MSELDNQGVCELCQEKVLTEQPHVRIGADAAIWNGQSKYESLTDNKVLVLAVFHSECVLDTMEEDCCDDIPYIWEARSLIGSADLCDECRAHVPEPTERPRLTLLQGGLR